MVAVLGLAISAPSERACAIRLERRQSLLGAGMRVSRAQCRPGNAGKVHPPTLCRCGWGQNGLMRVVVTRIEPDGTMQRRMVETARQSDRRLWEDLAARAIGVAVPYRPAAGIVVYHVRVDDYVVMAAEHDLVGPLLDLATAVMALGGEMLRPRPGDRMVRPSQTEGFTLKAGSANPEVAQTV